MSAVDRFRTRVLSITILVTFLLLVGCAQSPFSTSPGPELPPADFSSISSMVGNFDDIELPVDMKFNSEKSMAIRTDSFQGGILNFSGRVELGSLKDFIITSMENKRWKLVGEAQYKNVLLAFTKPNRTCMVVLDEGVGGAFGTTTATLYVTADMAAAGRLNPFGEPIN